MVWVLLAYLHYYFDSFYTPSWEEEYELKKAIKIEREIHGKALF